MAADMVPGSPDALVSSVLLLFNPQSNSGCNAAQRAARMLRRYGIEVQLEDSESAEDLKAICRRLADKVDCVAIAGGDGTLHHALPALREAARPLAVIPGGTANDFAKALGVADSVERACEAILCGRARRISVGIVNGEPFLNSLHVGLGALVATDTGSVTKKMLGIFAYLRRALHLLLTRRIFEAQVEGDGESHTLRSIHLSIGNAPYYGGGNRIHFLQDLGDDALHLYSVRPLPLWKLLMIAPMLRRGRGTSRHGVDRLRAKHFHVRTAPAMTISVDGERAGQTPAEVGMLHEEIRFITHPEEHPEMAQTLLLDETRSALRALAAKLQQVADFFEAAMELGKSEALVAKLKALAARRSEQAEALRQEVRRAGVLPQPPDEDFELVEQIIEKIKTTLASRSDETLRDDAVAHDEGLLECLDAVDAEELQPDTAQHLRRLRQALETDIADLRGLSL